MMITSREIERQTCKENPSFYLCTVHFYEYNVNILLPTNALLFNI